MYNRLITICIHNWRFMYTIFTILNRRWKISGNRQGYCPNIVLLKLVLIFELLSAVSLSLVVVV